MGNKDKIQDFYENTYNAYHASFDSSNFKKYARNLVLERLYPNTENQKLLDLGAGNGANSIFFLNKGYMVYAIEWNTAGVNQLNNLGVRTLQHDIENTPYQFTDNFFDEVFWGDNIEHLYFPEEVAREIYRILKPGGRLVLSTPNHGWIINRLYYFLKGIPRRTEGHKLPIWKWQHIRFFNSQELNNFLRHCDFKKPINVYGAEQRFPFNWLSRFLPKIMGSVLVVETWK
jgi:SAM-dependent methyltransferase